MSCSIRIAAWTSVVTLGPCIVAGVKPSRDLIQETWCLRSKILLLSFSVLDFQIKRRCRWQQTRYKIEEEGENG